MSSNLEDMGANLQPAVQSSADFATAPAVERPARPPSGTAACVPSVPYAPARRVRQALGARTAAEALGPIRPGVELAVVTDGGVSLLDCIVHALAATGPADVWVATWTIGAREVNQAYRLLSHGSIRSLHLVVDTSFPARQPAYCAALRVRFGDGAIRLVRSHVKAALLLNSDWHLVIRGSANLNENRRLELVEVSDCRILADYLRSILGAIFDQPAGRQGRGQTAREFDAFVASMAVSDPARFMGDGPLASDFRRVGWTFADTGKRLTE